MKPIVILQAPLTCKKDDVFAQSNKIIDIDPLCDAIIKVSESMKQNGVDVFERKENVIVTEQGYYVANWASDFKIDEESESGSRTWVSKK